MSVIGVLTATTAPNSLDMNRHGQVSVLQSHLHVFLFLCQVEVCGCPHHFAIRQHLKSKHTEDSRALWLWYSLLSHISGAVFEARLALYVSTQLWGSKERILIRVQRSGGGLFPLQYSLQLERMGWEGELKKFSSRASLLILTFPLLLFLSCPWDTVPEGSRHCETLGQFPLHIICKSSQKNINKDEKWGSGLGHYSVCTFNLFGLSCQAFRLVFFCCCFVFVFLHSVPNWKLQSLWGLIHSFPLSLSSLFMAFT